MPASPNVKPMRSCPKLGNNTPEMLVAATVNVRLAAVSTLMSLYTSVLLEGSDCSCATCAEHAAAQGAPLLVLPQETDEAE